MMSKAQKTEVAMGRLELAIGELLFAAEKFQSEAVAYQKRDLLRAARLYGQRITALTRLRK